MILGADPDPTSLGELVLGLSALLGLGLAAHKMRRHPPIEAEFVTKNEFEGRIKEVKQEIRRDVQRLEDRITGHAIANERRDAELHEKTNQVARDVAFIRGLMERNQKDGK